jgi:NAD(P)-dependent dehydrogenase (short-subunit alcohol dehydrogenase family)
MSTKKIALITGANKGIGLETARQLGKQGIMVLARARDEAKASRASQREKQPADTEACACLAGIVDADYPLRFS